MFRIVLKIEDVYFTHVVVRVGCTARLQLTLLCGGFVNCGWGRVASSYCRKPLPFCDCIIAFSEEPNKRELENCFCVFAKDYVSQANEREAGWLASENMEPSAQGPGCPQLGHGFFQASTSSTK